MSYRNSIRTDVAFSGEMFAAGSPQNCGKEPNHAAADPTRSASCGYAQDLLILALGLPIRGARARRRVGLNVLAEDSNEENCDVGSIWLFHGYSVLA